MKTKEQNTPYSLLQNKDTAVKYQELLQYNLDSDIYPETDDTIEGTREHMKCAVLIIV